MISTSEERDNEIDLRSEKEECFMIYKAFKNGVCKKIDGIIL